MKAENIRLYGTYRLKPEVFHNTVQANGKPHESPDVTVLRISYPEGRKRAWYYDAQGNAFRADDFKCSRDATLVELDELGEIL